MQKGTIVQITNNEHHWYPCLVIVSEVKSWGIMGYLSIPADNSGNVGNAFIRISTGQFEVVGEALIVVE
jgi:hypothetical protein